MQYKATTDRAEIDQYLEKILDQQCHRSYGTAKFYFRDQINDGDVSVKKIAVLTNNNKIIGWSVIVTGSVIDEAWVYVKKTHRRRGYGTKLLNLARENTQNQTHKICYGAAPEFWSNVQNVIRY